MRILGAATVCFLAACGTSSRSTFPDTPSSDAAPALPLADASRSDAPFGPDPPPLACDTDAADPCPSPPWACADGGTIAVSYGLGKCVSGSCVWQKADGNCAALGGTCANPDGVDGGTLDAGFEGPALPDGSAWATVGVCVVPVPAGPDPPATPCDADAATDGGLCPPPPSVCAGMDTIDSAGWLIYYDDGQCLGGQCVWQKKRTMCSGAFLCTAGACVDQRSDPAPN